jgi:hypothetical protein
MEEQVSWLVTPYRAPVLDASGDRMGTAESLLGDERQDIFHGLAVKLSDGGRVVEVPADKVSRITRSAVHTSVARSEIPGLQAYREEHWFHLGWGGLFRKRPGWREDS